MVRTPLIAFAALLLSAHAAAADDDFYAGKTVRIIIGTTTAGEYGAYAQLMAQHVGRFIPGRPTVIVQTMLGGGGLVALNHLAKIAPQDGTVLSLPHANIVQDGLLNPRAQFDPGHSSGSAAWRAWCRSAWRRSQSKARTLEDARQRELIAGASGVTNPTGLNPRILNALAGTKFKIVTGYKGTSEAAHRLGARRSRRGDHELGRHHRTLRRPVPRRADPSALHLRHDAAAGARPHSVDHRVRPQRRREGVPADLYHRRRDRPRLRVSARRSRHRVALWRTAFQTMLDDPEFKRTVAKSNIRLAPLDGATLAASVAKVVGLPKDTIAQAAVFYERLLAEVR